MLVYMKKVGRGVHAGIHGNSRLKFINQLGGEENVLPIESIKDESVTSKNKTAKNRPALEEKGALVGVSLTKCVRSLPYCQGTTYKPRKSLSLKKKKQFTFSSSVASSSYIE